MPRSKKQRASAATVASPISARPAKAKASTVDDRAASILRQCPLSDTFCEGLAEHPEKFLMKDERFSGAIMAASKWLFDFAKLSEPTKMSPLDELMIDGFDSEQVWEQIQLQNVPMTAYLSEKVQTIIENGDVAIDDEDDELSDSELPHMEEDDDLEDAEAMDSDDELDGLEDEDEDEDEGFGDDGDDGDELDGDELDGDIDLDEEGDNEDADDDEDLGEDLDLPVKHKGRAANVRPKKQYEQTEVDDEFFSLREMEDFAERAEARDIRKAERSDEEDDEDDEFDMGKDFLTQDPDAMEDSEDDNDDLDDLDASNNITYEEFFGPRETKKKVHFGANEATRKSAKGDGDSHSAATGFLPFPGANPRQPGDAEDAKAAENTEDAEDGDDNKITADKVKDLFDAAFDEAEDQGLSTFEKQQLKLQEQIKEVEAEALAEKSWTMRGEAGSKTRPMNSLLEEELDVELAAKPVPAITEEKTKSLEDLIKQRIKDNLFDDVEKKIPTKPREFDPNRRIELNDQKSSRSLAEEYEDDYMRQKQAAASGGATVTAKDEALQKQHEEIDELFSSLCHNLDILSNWHFTPKRATVDLEVLPSVSVPAIQMEEVTPAAVSDAALLTAKEVYAGQVGKSEEEKTSEDRKRERNKRKAIMRKEKAEKERNRKIMEKSHPEKIDTGKRAKEKAVESLMGQKNVTIIGDASKLKKGKKNVQARLVEKGGAVTESKKTERAENLRL
ncbi:U3 small nucleolar ribonucleoprotein complex, subunit Mpp10 [Polychytrium aggregatum]|uniref:U3 small nucleolar ribonucleoprotein complex, subunit Mpp10 n=1 Tax=Polychytrium aggregatum TaxID=110093 RepID=UPI0022FE3C3D|nr:U3 small nucleolar ribonucleoprotein complex, subunit Mpp10 [Polychytrium aggregatum]KAI9208522.1 U3 small nucleolar ribonucleoprotein complex, subunit Mpp10 [Polychytrium aggregatum]